MLSATILLAGVIFAGLIAGACINVLLELDEIDSVR